MNSRRFRIPAWRSATCSILAALFIVPCAHSASIPDRGATPASVSIPDGAGGAYLTWAELGDNPNEHDIFLTRVDGNGSPVWSPVSMQVCAAAGEQGGPSLASDGSGGVLVAWADYRDVNEPDIYVQRVNASGVPQWTTDGVVVTPPGSMQYGQVIASDGAGGAVVGWYDYRNGDADVYAQRLDGSGALLWTSGGVPVCALTGSVTAIAMTPTELGGTIFTWEDPRGGPIRLYAQRLSPSGSPRWTVNGVLVAGLPGPQVEPSIAPDGEGGAVIAWTHGLPPDLRAQRIDSTGTALWGSGGLLVCNAPAQQKEPAIVSDGAGGAVVAWTDWRNSEYSVYVQRVSAGGSALWTSNGIQVANNTVAAPHAVSDGTGGAYLAWTDMRADYGGDVYVQRVDGTGALRWSSGTQAVGAAAGGQYVRALTGDGAGGVIALWMDFRMGDNDYYGQRVDSTGVTHWSADGAPVAIVPGGQHSALLTADGSGGVFVGFYEKLGTQYFQRARRFEANGIATWPTAPVSLQSHVKRPMICVSDGAGGVIYAWHDQPAANDVITVQRIAGNGAPLWGPNGVAICASPESKDALALGSDGAGGAIVAWTMNSDPGPARHVIAQRVDANGSRQWGPCGITLALATGDQYEPAIVSDGLGGAIAVWTDYRSGSARCFGQHVDAGGASQWPTDGLPALTSEFAFGNLRAAPDGAGGIVLAWTDERNATTNVGAQRMGPDGALRWGDDGVVVTADSYGRAPAVVSDGDSGAVVVWVTVSQTFAQRVSAAGALLWGASGVTVCDAANSKEQASAVAMANHETGVAWLDYRSADHGDVYAQRLDGSGAAQWTANGVRASDGVTNCDVLAIAPDGAAGLYVGWEQYASAVTELRLSRIASNGVIAAGWAGDGTTAALASLIGADAEPGRVNLRWQVSGDAFDAAVVERSAGADSWTAMTSVAPDGLGRIAYEDRSVAPGARYGYRLLVRLSGRALALGEVWVDVPLAATLALAGLTPNPTAGDLVVTFALPDAQRASLELWDVSGRRVLTSEVGVLGAGRHTFRLGSGRELLPGIYWLRLVRGSERLTTRAVVIR